MKPILIIFLALSCLCFTACEAEDADDIQTRQTAQMAKEAAIKVGPPGIVNFTEKRFAKMIYELRDKEVKTYSYYLDMNGRRHFLCNSIGYGLPASVQYSNPERNRDGWRDSPNIPQPEPNGLFMPNSLSATYVLCVDEKGKVHPVYFEPLLIVSPFKLAAQ